MCVGEQMIRAEITVRRYDRSSCLICQDEGWHSASFIHCWWKYEQDLRHLALAQKRESKAKKSSKWQMTRNPFSFLTLLQPHLLHHSHKYFPCRAVGRLTGDRGQRDKQEDVRRCEEDIVAFLVLIANIQDQLTLLRFMDRLPESILCRRLHWDARSWALLECLSWL